MSCPDLHPELILEILCRLPVKSLCRFRCVSKSWFSLINHPTFAKLHLSKTQRQRLIIPAESLLSVDLENVSNNDDKVSPVKLDFPGNYSNYNLSFVSVVSSCNGLVCFINDNNDLLLYNPTTNECKQIWGFSFEHPITKPRGLGYAESIDDYKFVKMDYFRQFVEVYSLRAGSWKSIQNDLDLAGWWNLTGVPLNGAIHWVLLIERQNVIASFDLVDEKFETSILPGIVIEDDCSYSLGLLRDCLCLLVRDLTRNQIWVMEDYNDKASWTRILIVELSYRLQPLSYLQDGKTLLLCGDRRKLVFCNSEDGKFKITEVDGVRDDWFDACLYVESLVSPNYRTNIATGESQLGCFLE